LAANRRILASSIEFFVQACFSRRWLQGVLRTTHTVFFNECPKAPRQAEPGKLGNRTALSVAK